MIQCKIRKVNLSKSQLRQMRVNYSEKALRDAAVVHGWFYGEATLGREYSRSPYVLCEGEVGGPYLVRCEFYQFSCDTRLLKYGMMIPQIFV